MSGVGNAHDMTAVHGCIYYALRDLGPLTSTQIIRRLSSIFPEAIVRRGIDLASEQKVIVRKNQKAKWELK
jgi:hypothetical protein